MAITCSDRVLFDDFRAHTRTVFAMNLLLDELVAILTTGLIPFLRISAMLLAAPLVSLQVVNVRIRIALAFLLTVFFFDQIAIPAVNPLSVPWFVLIALELMIGIFLALILQIVNAAIVTAGQSMSMSMGLGMAQTIDPNAGQVPVIASFLVVLSTLIFLSVGGHLFLIELLLQSFSAIPIGGGDIDFAASIWNLTMWSSMAFLGAVLIALPVMLIMMLINLCIGVVTRAAPALNIFAVGFPAMLLGGLILIVIFMANFGSRIQWLWLEAFDVAQNLWVVQNG